MAESKTTSGIGQIATVAIPVADPERALAFYTQILGFEKRRDASFGDGLRWIEVAPADSVTTIALAPPGGNDVGVDTGIRLSCADAAAQHAYLLSRGVTLGDLMVWPGVPPMFMLRDPDGNQLYVVEG